MFARYKTFTEQHTYFFLLFELATYLHIEVTKIEENKKLITTKLIANKTRCKKLQTPRK